jgi:hypothetical protein
MRLIDADNLITYIKSTGLGTGIDTSQEDIVKAIEACPVAYATYNFPDLKQYYDNCLECAEQHEQFAKWLEELKSYKDAEEQGLLVRLPCKEAYSQSGDYAYLIDDYEIVKCVHCGLGIDSSSGKAYIALATDEKIFPRRSPDPEQDLEPADWCTNTTDAEVNEIGKTLFWTREEAEKKLEEMKNDKA